MMQKHTMLPQNLENELLCKNLTEPKKIKSAYSRTRIALEILAENALFLKLLVQLNHRNNHWSVYSNILTMQKYTLLPQNVENKFFPGLQLI
jgi:hypothetical protein